MVLFVKRTFAIKVSGTSRTDQSNEGRGGHGRGPALVRCQGTQEPFDSLRDGQSVGTFRDHSSPPPL